jgi:hypothetical protein
MCRQPYASIYKERTIAHVFGALKQWMGSNRFLTRGLPHVSTELSLNVLPDNRWGDVPMSSASWPMIARP